MAYGATVLSLHGMGVWVKLKQLSKSIFPRPITVMIGAFFVLLCFSWAFDIVLSRIGIKQGGKAIHGHGAQLAVVRLKHLISVLYKQSQLHPVEIGTIIFEEISAYITNMGKESYNK
ncbi:hypothetical protein V6N12_060238 [Hibiscus sabdariffa]|uniref:Uncharacterized protein n=1 Tax=Hibiscus sabdariffa TaxID=183260 RepID=A0ABR2D3U9_9ROSI